MRKYLVTRIMPNYICVKDLQYQNIRNCTSTLIRSDLLYLLGVHPDVDDVIWAQWSGPELIPMGYCLD